MCHLLICNFLISILFHSITIAKLMPDGTRRKWKKTTTLSFHIQCASSLVRFFCLACRGRQDLLYIFNLMAVLCFVKRISFSFFFGWARMEVFNGNVTKNFCLIHTLCVSLSFKHFFGDNIVRAGNGFSFNHSAFAKFLNFFFCCLLLRNKMELN